MSWGAVRIPTLLVTALRNESMFTESLLMVQKAQQQTGRTPRKEQHMLVTSAALHLQMTGDLLRMAAPLYILGAVLRPPQSQARYRCSSIPVPEHLHKIIRTLQRSIASAVDRAGGTPESSLLAECIYTCTPTCLCLLRAADLLLQLQEAIQQRFCCWRTAWHCMHPSRVGQNIVASCRRAEQ